MVVTSGIDESETVVEVFRSSRQRNVAGGKARCPRLASYMLDNEVHCSLSKPHSSVPPIDHEPPEIIGIRIAFVVG